MCIVWLFSCGILQAGQARRMELEQAPGSVIFVDCLFFRCCCWLLLLLLLLLFFFSPSSLSVNNCACLGFLTFKLLILADVASSSAPSRGEKCMEFTQSGQLRLAKLSSFSWRNVSTAAGLLETGDFGRRNCAPEGF